MEHRVLKCGSSPSPFLTFNPDPNLTPTLPHCPLPQVLFTEHRVLKCRSSPNPYLTYKL